MQCIYTHAHAHKIHTSQEDFVRSVEVWKETSKFREQSTQGGFYSEADMRKPVSEGGLGFSQIPDLHYFTLHFRLSCLVSGMACVIVNFFSSWMGFSTFHSKIRKKAQKTVAWCEANPGHTRCRGSTVLPGFRSTRQLERNYHPS